MENKKLVRLALIAFSGIIVLIIAEVLIRGINESIAERKKLAEIEREKELYESTPKYEEEIFLEGVVGDFVGLLNSKDKDALYEKINEEYKDYKFNSNKDVFYEYIDQYFDNDAEISLQAYEKVNGKYLCSILSLTSGEYSSFKVLVTQNEQDGSYDIIFDNIASLEKITNVSQKKGNLSITLLYKMTASGACSYTVEYKNLGKEVTYTHGDVTLKNTRGNEFYFDAQNEAIELQSGESARMEYVFSGKGINLYANTMLEIDLKDSTGVKHDLTLYLSE